MNAPLWSNRVPTNVYVVTYRVNLFLLQTQRFIGNADHIMDHVITYAFSPCKPATNSIN